MKQKKRSFCCKIEGMIVLGERGYWVMKLIDKMKEEGFNLHVRLRNLECS